MAHGMQIVLIRRVGASGFFPPKISVFCRFHDQGQDQGCQIFLGTTYQNGEKYTKLPQNCQMIINYTKLPYIPKNSKWA
jgi:hypothetical protein